MKTFKTLKQIKRFENQQVSILALLEGRMYLKDKGWSDVRLTEELREEIARRVCDIYGGHKATRQNVYNHLMSSNGGRHWTLDRMYFSCSKEMRLSYCAGQDYPYEMAQARKYFNSL